MDKYIGLKAYLREDETKREGVIGKTEEGFILKYPDTATYVEIESANRIILLEDICGVSYCNNREIFRDGICEVCWSKFSEF
jgi:hypothetical protein